MKTLFFIILLIFSSFALSQEVCVQAGKIKHIYQTKKVIEKKGFCYGPEFGAIKSLSCKKGKCQAYQFKKLSEKAKEGLLGEFGSPGFKLCIKFYHSIPQIISYNVKGEWKSSSICIFKDKSFIDTGRLMKNSFD